MKDLFEFSGGSVVGRSHRVAGRNNQDAYCWRSEADCSVAVVCDGCGSGGSSEVGARLGASLIAHTVLREACRLDWSAAATPAPEAVPALFWERVRRAVLARLLLLAEAMGESLSAVVSEYFLFTVVGALITPPAAYFFSLGDGVLIVNGEETPLGPFPDNAPPYLGYGLIETSLASTNPDALRFEVKRVLPTNCLQSFLIGTDGVHDLSRAAPRRMPGKTEIIGPLSQFWEDDAYFANPDRGRRRLAGANRDVTGLDRATGELRKEAGLLPDDTTFIVGRRINPKSDSIKEAPVILKERVATEESPSHRGILRVAPLPSE